MMTTAPMRGMLAGYFTGIRMKFVVNQRELSQAIGLVSRAVPSRPSRPILSNILLKANLDAQSLTLCGFDESLGIKVSIDASVSESGAITLPAKLLESIVSRLSEDLLVATLEDSEGVSIECSTGQYEVRGLAADEFPSLDTVDAGEAATIPSGLLLSGIQDTLFAASADESKQVLTGVHLLSDGNSLEFAATDGHRLSVSASVFSMELDTLESFELTIPAKSMREIERIISNYDGDVSVEYSRHLLSIKTDSHQLSTRLLEGQYPNYRNLIPASFERTVTVSKKAFTGALERIAVLAEQKNNIVKVCLGADNLKVSVEASEVGSGVETVPCTNTGTAIDIAFNVRYLLEGIKAIVSPDIQLKSNGPTQPSILTAANDGMTYMVMPVQIRK